MQQGRRLIVGVVDDDAAVCDSLRFLLEAAGFPVLAFASAEQFLATADRARIGCLLLDHHMPVITGLDLLQRLRSSGHEVRVALMTGSPSAQLTRRALELGAAVVLEKPLAEQALFQFLDDTTG